ncbi:MAG: MFS transporter [Noviherbaspirillum sp.]
MASMFRSLKNFNYRLWAGGALVSNIGTWMQRIAQDWLVLTQLTDQNATAVGLVMALQFGPSLLLLPLTGYAADRFDRRRLLCATQAVMGTLALGLGILTLGGWIDLWHVFLFAFLLGCATAFDGPARQTFVADLVGEEGLMNAVALNSVSFNSARLIGPAVAGVLIASVGEGWMFLLNAASFGAVLCALGMMRPEELIKRDRLPAARGALTEGLRYVWARPDLLAVMLMVFLVSAFGLNFPIFISTMVVTAFDAGADSFGLLTSMMAAGSVTGALLTARRAQPLIKHLAISSALFGTACVLAALAPGYGTFGVILVAVGVCAQTFTTSSNSLMQLSTAPHMRGRVMAIHMAILMGTTPIGAPAVGWIADRFGPRWALGIAAAAGIGAAIVGFRHIRKARDAGVAPDGGRLG